MAGEVLPPTSNSNNGTGRRPAGSYHSFGEQGHGSGGGSGYGSIGREGRGGGGGGGTRSKTTGTGRPWIELVTWQGFGKPMSLAEAMDRLKHNLRYFRKNYVISALVIVGLSLLWRPISLLVLAFLVALWIYFYFSRFDGQDQDEDQQFMVLGRPIGENIILVFLSVMSVLLLTLTPRSRTPLLVSILIIFVLITLHASFRRNDLLVLDDGVEDRRNTLLASQV